MGSAVERQVAGVFHRRVGDITVTALNDGHQDASLSTLSNITEEEAAALLRGAFRPVPRRTQVQCFLIRSAGRVALVDTGCGPIKPTTGMLAANLAAAGVKPEQVDTLLMTHFHPDHCGGLVGADGERLFPKAEMRLHPAERDYWQSDAALARGPMAQTARKAIAAYADRTTPYADGQEVLPGVTGMHLPGHTPGHSGFMIASGGKALLIWADIVHAPEIQVPRPEVGMAVDVDPVQAIATRRRIFDMVAADRLGFTGMHLHFPAFCHMAREGDGYRLVPDAWTIDLNGDTP